MQARYEIDSETFAIKGYLGDQEAPVLFQPDYPDGTPWGSYENAKAWADAWIFHWEDPENNPFNPPLPAGA